MNEHFIKNIEIKNFKCFKDFKAEGFGRVNLIGGKNNVGKTAFMESCYLISNLSNVISEHPTFTYNYGASKIEREWLYFEMIKSLIIVEQNRKNTDFLIEWIKDEFELNTFGFFEIILNDKYKITLEDNTLMPEYKYRNWSNYGSALLSQYRENKYLYQIHKKNNPPQINNSTFMSPCSSNHSNLINMIDTLKIEGKYDSINQLFSQIFKIEKVDVIKNKVMLEQDNKFKDLNDFGDGLKQFLNIMLALLVNKDKVIYLDEIGNGIHYTLLDKLWEEILTISKRQNVQIFATTHSKECIESYARVAKRLKDEEIAFLDMGRKKDGSVAMITMTSKQFQDEINMTNEVRGW